MARRRGFRKLTGMLSPWLVVATAVILLPIFLVMTLQSLERQKHQAERLLLEKGLALIRSFEAGVRTAAGFRWGYIPLQKLLIETARQPGIDYLLVTDRDGTILAGSDPSLVGETYGTDLDPEALATVASGQWRQVPHPQGADTFEVYRRFVAPEDAPPFAPEKKRPPRIGETGEREGEAARQGLIIFVGLDMGPVWAARAEDRRRALWMVLLFLLIGTAAVMGLFLAQRYRSARITLRQVQAFAEELLDRLPVGVVAVDQEERILRFNPAAARILDSRELEMLGREAERVLPPACVERLRSVRTTEGILTEEVDCPLPGNRSVPLEITATTLRTADGDAVGKVVLLRDLTELRQLKEEVMRHQRLASLGNLAAGVAHEIRTPLSSIKGFATYFRERYRQSPEDVRVAGILIEEVERLDRVIGQLLEFARPTPLRRQPTDLSALLDTVRRLLEARAQSRGTVIRTDIRGSVGEIAVDPDRIKQVLLNLGVNALEAMDTGGVLMLRLCGEGDAALVEVGDTGKGIAPADLDRIFDPYFTTKSSGTGLGLAIVHQIVKAHGGQVRVESRPDGGTTFFIRLPYTPEEGNVL